ncbi:MAG: MetQ/NlpA family ABC transporter substrate-binding protein [Candidatus Berkiellales bacterium]
MLRKKFFITSLLCLALACFFTACSPKQRSEHEIIIGTIAGPETHLVETAKKVAEQRYGLKLTIVTFEDYIVPNTALAEGDIDANMFQHQPYLDVVLAKKGYKLIPIGTMFIYPMGVYSKKYKHLTDLPNGAKIGIPNDPSNAARALRLLAKAKLITIPKVNDLQLSPRLIQHNPKNLVIKEIPAAQLARVLPDLDAAVINTNYAIPAGLQQRDALFLEDKSSPYANIVVIRTEEKDQKKYQDLMAALHSPEVLEKAKKLFADQAIPAWQQ